VVKLNPAGNAAVYATYLGGSGYDSAYGIALDRANDADVTGNTTSATFPTTANTPQRTYGGGQGSYGDVFVTELAPTGERAGLQHLPGRRAGRDATTRSAASARSTALAPCGERYGSSGAAAPTRD
jgi:hypothetical protein